MEGDKKSSRTENLQTYLCCAPPRAALHGLNAPGCVCDLSSSGSGLPQCYQALSPASSRVPQVVHTILPAAATPQHTQHPRKALPGLLRCCSMIQTNLGCPRKEGNGGEKHFPAQGKDTGSKQDAPHMAWKRLGAPKQSHAQDFALPQWIYRSDRAPSFSQLGDSSSSTQPCQHWSTFPCPCQPTGAGPIYATP